MEKTLLKVFAYIGMLSMLAAFNLLMAFPIKWTWNYVMPYLFAFKVISWGHAWCLSFLASVLIRSFNYTKEVKE